MSKTFSIILQYFHTENMWIEELLKYDRPIPISIHFWEILKTDTSGSIRPSASTAGINQYIGKILVCGVFGTPNHLISSTDLLSKTTYIYPFKLTLYVIQKLQYREICIFGAAILKIQNGGHTGICANVIIDFLIPDAISFPKMCYISNLHEIWTKTLWMT